MRAQTRPFEGLDVDLARLIRDLESLDPRRRPTARVAEARLGVGQLSRMSYRNGDLAKLCREKGLATSF